jgi:hypothetical protein
MYLAVTPSRIAPNMISTTTYPNVEDNCASKGCSIVASARAINVPDLILLQLPTSNLFIYLPVPGRGRSRFLPPGSGVLALQRIKVVLHFLSHLLFGQALIVSGGNEWHSVVDLDQYE